MEPGRSAKMWKETLLLKLYSSLPSLFRVLAALYITHWEYPTWTTIPKGRKLQLY